jgi:type I restriction enzyme S subunit
MNKELKLIPQLRFPEFLNAGDWDGDSLVNIAKFRRGSFPQPYGLPKWYDDENGMPFIQVYDVGEDFRLKPKTKSKISKLGAKQSVFIKKGTVIITIQGSIGRVAITQYDAYIDRTLLLFEEFYNEIDKTFFAYILFLLFEIEKQKAPGGIIKTITKEVLSDFVVSFPKPAEQEKIASCLSSLDELLAAHNDKLESLKNHKKGLMQNLFPQEGETVPKYRFREFEDDGEWVEKTLTQVADYENGKAHEKDIDENGKYIVVNSKFISTEGGTVKYSKTAYCPAKQGDILMVLSDIPNGRAIAKCFYVNEDDKYSVNQRICKITPFDAEELFLFYIMNRNSYFLAFDDGVKQTNLRKDDVLDFSFLIPNNPDEQRKISLCISAVDQLTIAQAEKIEQLQQHKKGLMQGLFPKTES